MGLEMMNEYKKKILDEQYQQLAAARALCIKEHGKNVTNDVITYINENTKTRMCPAFWDGILCWPDAHSGTLLSMPCPPAVYGFIPSHNATRQCMEGGYWYFQNESFASWTNYTSCFKNQTTTVLMNIHTEEVSKLLENYVPIVKIISKTGYIVSLLTLIIAFTIMLCIKKLHCARNILHMHLFMSFMLRASITLVKDLTFMDGIGFQSDMHRDQNGSLYFKVDSENNWSCKLMTSLWQYFITANYSWILMEGLYLHNLIFHALFADSNRSIRWYVILGWGLPLLVICKWVIVRLLVEDTFCWSTNENFRVFLIIVIPTSISIVVNLVIFVKISVVLYRKLRSPMNEDSKKYQKWVRSTLVLVPLFGVHYAVFLLLYYRFQTNKIIELVWLTCDQLFASFQGYFVAVLYCFMNGEVKSEIKPHFCYFLSFLATNKYSKCCFPCRKRFLRSVVGRNSVCTTMSCSSLYTNGVIHRNSKPKLDGLPKARHHSSHQILSDREKSKNDHVCHNGKSLQDLSRRKSGHSHPLHLMGSNLTTETTLTLEVRPENGHSDSEVNEEMIRMVPKGNF